jgi:hypothetical protein
MAVGDVFAGGPTSIANGAFMNMQPATGAEAIVNNILLPEVPDGFELHFFDGTTSEKIRQLSSSFYGLYLRVTNTRYYRIKNVSGSAKNCGWDGVTTKV